MLRFLLIGIFVSIPVLVASQTETRKKLTQIGRGILVNTNVIATVSTQSNGIAPTPFAAKLIEVARSQIGITVGYDPAYVGLAFPGGDIDRSRGVCTDVVIRALRDAHDIDLQLLVNRDMKANFSAYPQIWGLKSTDRNIDHRRVPNLETYLTRRGMALPVSGDAAQYLPGDIVTWRLPGNLPHIGVVSDNLSADGVPMIIHNIGAGAHHEDILFAYTIKGHFRPDQGTF